jgi:DNA primase
MKFPPHLLDDIRARLPVSSVVGSRVQLRRQGREFVGLSPFKMEKTPSFTVNDQKGFYHCFATGEHGDIFTFVMKTQGLSFPEAVEQLAREAGVALPQPSEHEEVREAERDRLYRLMEVSCAWFQARLDDGQGREASAYLRDRRGLSDAIIARFRLGYAPRDRQALRRHLASSGFSAADMAVAGMIIAGEDIATPYDRFSHRVIFPITDLRGRVIAFGGRAMDADQRAKYLNSPETPLFHKGDVLFNAAQARTPAHERGEVIVVEGYMDVIALAEAGFAHAVAPLGTALTPAQIKLLWRFAPEPVLCFDGDVAGTKAAYRALETALPLLSPGRSLRFAFLPDALDPDDLIRERGADAMSQALDNARPLVDVLWAKEVASGDWTTPERRAALERRLEALVGTIAEPSVRGHYLRDMKGRVFEMFRTSRVPRARSDVWQKRGFDGRGRAGSRGKGSDRGYLAANAVGPSESLMKSSLWAQAKPLMPPREALILSALMEHPWLLDEMAEEAAGLHLESAMLSELRDAVVATHMEMNPLDKDSLRHQLKLTGKYEIAERAARAISHCSDANLRLGASRDTVMAAWRHLIALHRKITDLKQELALAALRRRVGRCSVWPCS